MTLKEFVRMLWAGKWLIVVAVIIGGAASVAYLQTRTVIYSSTASVQFRADAPQAGTVAPPTLAVDSELAASTEVAARAAVLLGDKGTGVNLLTDVSTSVDPTTSRVFITAQATDPAAAEKLANAFAQGYVAQVGADWDALLKGIEANMASTKDKAAVLDAATKANPGDPIAAADLAAVLSSYGTLATQSNLGGALGSPAVLAQAASSGTPQGMNSKVALALGVLAGALLGLGLALLRRALDTSVTNAKVARDVSGVPVLAELADVRRSVVKAGGALPVDGRAATPFTESIRELRTAIQAALGDQPLVIVVTATEPDAPRSFIAANLAASWALSGRDTVVMSGDLRRGELDELLPAPPGWKPGSLEVSGALAAMRPTSVSGLRFLPAPETALDPADYLASSSARQLIARIRGSAQVVIIDAPPVLAAADAIILGGYAEGVVLIATVGQTSRTVLENAAARLTSAKVRLLGIALHGRTADRRMTYVSTYAPAGALPQDSSSKKGRRRVDEEQHNPSRSSV